MFIYFSIFLSVSLKQPNNHQKPSNNPQPTTATITHNYCHCKYILSQNNNNNYLKKKNQQQQQQPYSETKLITKPTTWNRQHHAIHHRFSKNTQTNHQLTSNYSPKKINKRERERENRWFKNDFLSSKVLSLAIQMLWVFGVWGC